MLNYIRSELYRTIHNKGFLGATGILAGLAVVLHVVLWLFAANSPSFSYATSSFSYSLLVSTPDLFRIAAFVIVCVLYESDRRNGNDKNSIAFGISRTKIFIGKCVASLCACVAAMAVVLAVYIGGAMLLTEQSGPVQLTDLLREVVAVFPASVSAMVLGVVLLLTFEKNGLVALAMYVILFGVPKVLMLVGLQVEPVLKLAVWLPTNLFAIGMEVNMSRCVTIWSTPEGMVHCLLAGTGGILLFGVLGVLALRKRDI